MKQHIPNCHSDVSLLTVQWVWDQITPQWAPQSVCISPLPVSCPSPAPSLLFSASLTSKSRSKRKDYGGESLQYSVSVKKKKKKKSWNTFYLSVVPLTVGIEISDFVCRWFLLHVFKPCTQSRSTISLLPCCLTELCAYICGRVRLYELHSQCSRLQQQQEKIGNVFAFSSFKRNLLNINFLPCRGLRNNWCTQSNTVEYIIEMQQWQQLGVLIEIINVAVCVDCLRPDF